MSLLDVCKLFGKLGILAEVLLCNYLRYIGKEESLDAEHSSVSCRTAKKSSENVSASLVGRNDAVAYHKGRGADVVGDNTEGDIVLCILSVLYSGLIYDRLHNISYGIYLENII